MQVKPDELEAEYDSVRGGKLGGRDCAKVASGDTTRNTRNDRVIEHDALE
jgi:hypothetical protein